MQGSPHSPLIDDSTCQHSVFSLRILLFTSWTFSIFVVLVKLSRLVIFPSVIEILSILNNSEFATLSLRARGSYNISNLYLTSSFLVNDCARSCGGQITTYGYHHTFSFSPQIHHKPNLYLSFLLKKVWQNTPISVVRGVQF